MPKKNEKNLDMIDYKKSDALRKFLDSQFRIKNHKYTGLSTKDQRRVANAVKIARFMGFLPYTRAQIRSNQPVRPAPEE
ncbi:MAG: 30S ribosomal protein S18 [Candidatus Yanofskybacteria bacterium CG10_big_fil_rev_8_21_14_0_10_46_23]|uniref:30S ribosomal protein S18 n=1 Tax=Candidatus Yanofskybacteria bacterium CG10_big_fil_rev_8_21_14_0_10_46_23 TaxID=1975098 RepID=A0A2H0R514_9BACT|nr:MAG: 30S ribosomal protein S18 [Candidatus Yanofskybacteria bacterium CG10_big_fil_rev_8_21_14_0_10_46_23]